MSYRMAMMLNITPPTPYTPGEVEGYVPSTTAPFIKPDDIGDFANIIIKERDNIASQMIRTSAGTLILETGNIYSYWNPKLYRSIDNGETWVECLDSVDLLESNGHPFQGYQLPCGSIFQDTDGTIYYSVIRAYTTNHIWKSVDDGLNWTLHTAHPSLTLFGGLVNLGSGQFLSACPKWGGMAFQITRSLNYGVDWTVEEPTPGNYGSFNIPACLQVVGNYVFTKSAQYNQLMYSSKTSNPFVWSECDLDEAMDVDSNQALRIAENTSSSGKLYFIFRNLLYSSSDSGITWTLIKTFDLGQVSSRSSIYVRGSRILVFIEEYNFYLSEDEGATWDYKDVRELSANPTCHPNKFIAGNSYEVWLPLAKNSNEVEGVDRVALLKFIP